MARSWLVGHGGSLAEVRGAHKRFQCILIKQLTFFFCKRSFIIMLNQAYLGGEPMSGPIEGT